MAIINQIITVDDPFFMPDKRSINNAKRNLRRYYEYCDFKIRTEEKPFFESAWYDVNHFKCPACETTVTGSLMESKGIDWYEFLTNATKSEDPLNYEVQVPCCNNTVKLSDLNFKSRDGLPMAAITRFRIKVYDIEDYLTEQQKQRLEKNLGCKLIFFPFVDD